MVPIGGATHQYATNAAGTVVSTNANAQIVAGHRGSAAFNCTTASGMAVVNLKYSLGCSGTRVPVLATVVIPSIQAVSSAASVCSGNPVNLAVSSSNDSNYLYTWTSAPSGFTASGAGPHSASPVVTTKYIVNAVDTTGGTYAGCVTSDSVSVTTGVLAAGTVHSTDSVLCLSGSPTLSVTGASGGTIQWQVSTTGAGGPFTNVGSDSVNYTPGVPFTQTTYYRAEVRCDSVTALTTNTDSVVVFNPQVTNTYPATRCGPGNVTLSASGSSGTSVNWYDASSGGSLLSSGDTITTYIDSTTTLYASATTSGGGSGVAPMPAEGSVFSGNVRGFWFTSPVSFTITGLQCMASAAGLQSIAVVRFNPATPPPTYSTTTNAFTTLFLTQNNPATGVIPVNIPVSAGDVIGILSQRGNGTSYATPTGPYVTTIAGQPVTLTRMGMQFPLGTTAPQDLWQEPAAAIGRTEITYSTGCESIRVPVVATFIAPPAMNTVTSLYSLCATSCDTLRVDSAGVANYQQFTWVPSAGLSSTVLSTVTACPSVTTTYTVYAADTVNGCLNFDTVRVNVTPLPSVAMSVTPALSCVGDSVQLESGALGGPASPILLTTPLTVGNSSSATGFDIQNTSAVPVKIHFLSFTSTAASGTSLTESVYYNPSPMNCVFPANVTIAPGWSLVGTVGCTSAGTAPNLTLIPLDLNITIPPGATYAFCLGGASVAYSNGTTGCTVPVIAADGYISIREGFGGTLTSTIANRRFNGQVSYTYGGFVTNLWSPPTGLSDINIHNPKASPAVTTTYTVLVTDTTTGCTNTGTVTANVSTSPQPYVFPNDTMLCTGSIINIVARDSGAYSGGWPAGTLFDYGFGPTNDSTFQVNGPGLYNVVVTLPISMASCNSVSGFASIVFRDAPVLFVNTDSVKCRGGSDGYVSAQSFLGVPPYRYIYYNSLGNVIHDTITPFPEDTLFNLPAGQYSIVVYDTANAVYPPPSCRSDSIPVIVPEPDELVASESHPVVACFGNSTQVTLTATGGTPPYTGLGTFTQFAGNQTYYISDAHGCTDSIVVTVTEPALLVVSLATSPNLCSGYGTSAITSSVTGGTPGFTYLWNNGSTTANRSSVTAGTYTVTVTDDHGCTASSSITTVPISPVVITGTIVHVTCKGAKTGSITVSVSGGEPNYSYLWNNGSTTQNRTAIGYGTYIVTVTDANGCTKKASFVVNQPATQLIVNTSKTNVRCYGKNNGKATASPTGGVPPYTYSWNTLPVQTTASISGLFAGVYTCTVTDSIGCVKTATVTITEPPDMIVFQTQTNVTVNGGNDGTATVSVSGGTPGYTYQWNTVPVQTTTTATGLTAGTYKCTVIDSKSCSKKVTFIITEPPLRQTGTPAQPSAGDWDVRLYPNPTSGVVMIRFAHDAETDFTVSLTDFTGREVYEKEGRSVRGMNEVVYDFTGFAKGIYLVKVTSLNRHRTLRMVIQ